MTAKFNFNTIHTVNVVGAGVFGTSTALELKHRYPHLDVTIYDAAQQLPNADCSSCDTHRIVRPDYGNDPLYTELALQAIDVWLQWNQLYNTVVYRHCGFLLLCKSAMRSDSYEQQSYNLLQSMNIPVVLLSKQLLQQKYQYWEHKPAVPMHTQQHSTRYNDAEQHNNQNDSVYSGYFNPYAGWVDATHGVQLRIQQLREAGVRIQCNTRIVKLLYDGSKVTGMQDNSGKQYDSDITVLACGTWTTQLLPELHGTLVSTAQPSVYYTVPAEQQHVYSSDNFPVYGHDLQQSGFYGFPLSADNFVKIGHHGPGLTGFNDPSETVTVPHTTINAFRHFVQQYLPHLHRYGTLVKTRVCWYCDSVDGNWLVDWHRDKQNLFIATGGSGHGYKFLPVIGRCFVDIMQGQSVLHDGKQRWRYRLKDELSDAERNKSDACRSTGAELATLQANL